VPVSFLSDEQRRRYGRFIGEPTQEQLDRYFHLDDLDRSVINLHRGDHSRLGFAIQLCTARFLGTFLDNLDDVPAGVVNCVARQLRINQLSCFLYYCSNDESRWDHAAEIRRHCGFHDFNDARIQFRLNRWLYAVCWTGTDRPGILFDRATTWLITHKVLLPAVTTLERHISRLRGRVDEHLWLMLTAAARPKAQPKLESLLAVPEGAHQSLLDRLRKGPYRRSAPELVRALQRVDEVRNLGIDVSVSHRIPPTRLQALARFASAAKVSVLRKLPEARRIGTLIAFVSNLESTALDDALDLLDILITEIFSDAERASNKARLRTIKDLDAAAIQLTQVCRLVLDSAIADADLRSAIFNILERDGLTTAITRVDALVRPPDDVYYRELEENYRKVRRFLPRLLSTVHFGSTPAGQGVIDALSYLFAVEEKGRTKAGDPPVSIVTRGWRRYVSSGETFEHKAYVFCCLDRIRSALRRRDIFVAPSVRYADARIGLLNGPAWSSARSTVCRSLGHSSSPQETLDKLTRHLDQTYRRVAANLPANASARIERVDGQDELIVTALDKLDEPASLLKLREEVVARIPRVDLPEVLLEIAARTDLALRFTHVSERESRMQDFATSKMIPK
jgi:hypothetical protein